MSARSKHVGAGLELALTVTSLFSSPLLQLDKDKTSVGIVLASPRLADFSLQSATPHAGDQSHSYEIRSRRTPTATQVLRLPTAIYALPSPSSSCRGGCAEETHARTALQSPTSWACVFVCALRPLLVTDAAGHKYVVRLTCPLPFLGMLIRVNQITRGSFAIQTFGVVYLGSARLGCRSYIVHPGRSRSARGSRRIRIGAGEKQKQKQKKGAVGIGTGHLRQTVQTHSDMLTPWVRRAFGRSLRRFFEPRADGFASRIAIRFRFSPARGHHPDRVCTAPARLPDALDESTPPIQPLSIPPENGAPLRMGEEMAGALLIARCTPFRPLRSTAPAHMVERGGYGGAMTCARHLMRCGARLVWRPKNPPIPPSRRSSISSTHMKIEDFRMCAAPPRPA
ncbi:hypothetical protein B0H14DRAFT_3458236 [Mycena olivaceomarginata]|nr:hypothetical protein B0H14DRAFT_3458236 [Mycena olivaceomarginata]